MLASIIQWSIKNRFLVLIVTLLLSLWGLISVQNTTLDAIPDLSDVQIIIRTSYPGQTPKVVEDQITYPLTTTMLAVPGTKAVRGYSFFGDSYVYVIFKDGTDLYWARSRVLEYLNQTAESLPEGVQPRLGPDATGVGWIYSYALVDHSGKYDLSQLRSLQDWFLKFELQTVPGVAEVATAGGMVRQYQIIANPEQLRAYGIPLSTLARAIKDSNHEVGGSVMELSEAEYMIHTKGYLTSLQDIELIPVTTTRNGKTLLVRDLARVQIGPEMRRVVCDLDGKGEVTGGIIVMRYGENALKTIKAVKAKLQALKKGLPEGVEIVETYDRSGLILRAVDNLSNKLQQEFLVIALVCLLFLLHIRSAFVAIVTLPLGILLAFIVMKNQGVNANIMSLGGIAIAIGTMVDAAIVMIENAHKHLERWYNKHPGQVLGINEHWSLITRSAVEVGPALFFSLLIITLSFVPVFTLQAQEGRLFTPLALTKTYAMAAAAGLSVTLVPVLMGYFIRGRIPHEQANPLNRWLINAYKPLLKTTLNKPRRVILIALFAIVISILPVTGISGFLAPLKWPVEFLSETHSTGSDDSAWIQQVNQWQHLIARKWNKMFSDYPVIRQLANGLGTEFMPELDEGDLIYMPTTLPGFPIGKAQELLQQTDRLIAGLPEVKRVWGKIGRADTATDPAPLTMLETIIQLHPKDQWRQGMTLQKLIKELDQTVNVPGLTNAWLMPIKTRIDMISTGIKTPVGIKIAGEDLSVIESIGKQIESLLAEQPGTASVYSERLTGGRYIEITPYREKAAYLGLSMKAINEVISAAVGGINITYTIEGKQRYPVNLRFAREIRDDLRKLSELPVTTPSGAVIALEQLADIKIVDGPPLYKSENARLNGWVFVDIRGVALNSYVQTAKRLIENHIKLPVGYSITFAGQFEYLQRAREKLYQVIPFTLVIIFLLLYLIFRQVAEVLLVMLTLPFALIGGFWLLAILQYHISVATAVGMIALAGIAVEFGVIMLVYLDQSVKEKASKQQLNTLADLRRAIIEGAVLRVRPKIMTVAVILAGLLPIMLTTGTGSEVMQRIAAPIIGGMITAPILSLFLIPVLYYLWKAGSIKSRL